MHKTKPRWLAIEGKLDISESGIKYIGLKLPDEKTSSEPKAGTKLVARPRPDAVIRSDLYFESGDISGEAKISDPELRLFFRIGSAGDSRSSVGLGVQGETYGLAVVDKGQPKLIDFAGSGSTPPIKRWFSFRIRVRGSQLEFFVDNVRVLQGTTQVPRAQVEVVFFGEGTVELRDISIEAVRPQAFVVMQFTETYTALYKEVIEPVCIEFGYQVIRGDNVYTNGLIIEDITRSIRECSVVIADITPNNANVYYELGYAHGIGKQAILLSDRNREKLPFDISGFRLLFYDNTIGGKAHVEQALRRHLEAIRGA